jgi:2-keto-4-pentenoate hydratase
MSQDISHAVQTLLDARRTGRQAKPAFALKDRAAVYAIQDGVAAATAPVAGWKVGARTPTAEPNPAPLLAGALVPVAGALRR